jgi:hypothetical protein
MFAKAAHDQPDLLDKLWTLQQQVFTTGEFNYQFPDDTVRDQALETVVEHFQSQGASATTRTADGIDLQGTVLQRGVNADDRGGLTVEAGWFSGYLRVATNEKGVVRSYFSAGETRTGERVEEQARDILENQFNGQVIE